MSAPVATTPRLTVRAAGGGEGASMVTRLLAVILSDAGQAVSILSRVDDPVVFARPSSLPTVALVDAGPHGLDGTAQEGDITILVCAGNTASIERGHRLLAEGDARGHRTVALVVCARTPAESRRARIRIENATRMDPRVVTLPYDPALPAAHGMGELSNHSRRAADRLRAILTS